LIDWIKDVPQIVSVSEQNPDVALGIARISVVIPTYYRSMDLSKLIDSIFEQTKKPIEIIIVDDTPNPSIKLIYERYEKKFREIGVHLFYVKNPKERSISIARNLGARMAKGDIVQFFDSDVILHPDYLREVQNTFERNPEALGVAGWAVWNESIPTGVRENAIQTLQKIFFLFHHARNSCKHFEIPVFLNEEILCEYLSGGYSAFKHSVFSEFQFDENLRKYSFMEDVLFSGLIDEAYPKRLILTPRAKCYHMGSKEGKMEKSELRLHKLHCRKYVLTKLFGCWGSLLYSWQNIGLLVFRLISRVTRSDLVSKEL
jgi:glycosyltransferase involved in cell wall biosynthesis